MQSISTAHVLNSELGYDHIIRGILSSLLPEAETLLSCFLAAFQPRHRCEAFDWLLSRALFLNNVSPETHPSIGRHNFCGLSQYVSSSIACCSFVGLTQKSIYISFIGNLAGSRS